MTEQVSQELLEALKAMLSCFDGEGTLIIYPGSSQFKPVDDATEAIDILTAARRAVANAEPKFRPIPSYGSLMALDSFLDMLWMQAWSYPHKIRVFHGSSNWEAP